MKKERVLQGKLSICRTTGRDDNREVKIELIDELSGAQCVAIHLSGEAFGLAVTGASHQPCEFRFRPAVVGKKREHKSVPVFIPYASSLACKNGNKRIRQAVAEFEVDGWKDRDDDAANHHKRTAAQQARTDGETRLVTYERYVAAPEEKA